MSIKNLVTAEKVVFHNCPRLHDLSLLKYAQSCYSDPCY